ITVYLWPIRFRDGEILAGLIGSVCTHPVHRRRGYVRMLMEDAKNFMRDEGVTVSWLYGKQTVYGPCGYDTFKNYSILAAEGFAKPEPDLTLRPLDLARDYEAVKKIYETWNINTFGPTVRLEGDWRKRILAEKTSHGDIARFYSVAENGGRMIAYCHILPDDDHSIGEFGALDEKAAARALPVIAREVGGHIQFCCDHEKVENGAKLANAKIARKQGNNGMWLVINGSRLGLPERASPTELFGFLQQERFVYYYVDHF
ncbi:MAG: GNAT family N-acetyltransferase, partial [Kiritimatiellia bacterium]|nr:GNAT family N-acetyltransferase [Kiritimatiellia bacterium]